MLLACAFESFQSHRRRFSRDSGRPLRQSKHRRPNRCQPSFNHPELPSDEIYQHDLIGVKVKTDDGRDLGAVTGIVPTGAVDVLEIRGPLGEVLVPMAGDFIVSMDLERNEMVVRLIEGLLPEEK